MFDSGCCDSQCSILFAAALVVSMLVPNGSWTSTNNSGRSEFGKNCFFTTAILRPPLETPQLQCRLPYIFSSRTKRQNGETAGISESSRSPHGLLLRL